MNYEKESVLNSQAGEVSHVSNATLMTVDVFDEIRKIYESFAKRTRCGHGQPLDIALHQVPCYTTPVPDKMHL